MHNMTCTYNLALAKDLSTAMLPPSRELKVVLSKFIVHVCYGLHVRFYHPSPPLAQLVVFVRDFFGRRNIARKTLVDERFLL